MKQYDELGGRGDLGDLLKPIIECFHGLFLGFCLRWPDKSNEREYNERDTDHYR